MKSSKLAFLAAVLATFSVGFAVGCDDGPVGKAINCAQICERFDDCVSATDKSDCKDSCKDDVSNDDAAKCSDCLDSDSCGECASDCAGVGIDLLFSK